ncbi:MAG: glycosyltransferase [Pseudomonadota bacterium]
MSERTKILFIIDCFKNPYAGTEGQLMKLVNGLDKASFSPRLVVLRDTFYMKGEDIPVPTEIPFTADVLNIQGLSSLDSWTRLYRYLKGKRTEGYVLAHTFFYDAALICPPILKLLGYRVLVSRRDMGYWYTAVNLAVLRMNSLFVDRVVANSEAVKAITVRKEWYRPQRVEVIYNGYQETSVRDDQEIADEVPLGDGLSVVLVANIRPIKRVEDAVRALRLALDSVPGITLYVIGDGDSTQLEQLGAELGIGSSLRFLGARTDIPQLLRRFDVGILCSESEGFSNALIEYMQAGLAVVCSNVGGNPEIIENGVNGFLFCMGDAHALASHLVQLAENEQLRTQLADAGRGKVRSNYALSRYIDRHQSLYHELVPGRPI